jgi:transposase-like protein
VLQLLRGESLEGVSRQTGVTAATLSAWRDDFLAAGEAGLKTRAASPQDDEVKDLKAMIGELTMDRAILEEFIKLRGFTPPFARRSSA